MTNSVKFTQITATDIGQLMPIENSCHSHPWSEKTFTSCIGGRYFSEKCTEHNEGRQTIIGFYVADFIIDEATLMDICVKPSEQGKGFGKKTMVEALKKLPMDFGLQMMVVVF